MSGARRWDAPLQQWFSARGWKVAAFQREVWQRYRRGESGLIHTPTGSGKTLAAFGGPCLEALAGQMPVRAAGAGPLVLWITPLRALAADTTRSLMQTSSELGLPWTVAMRTGDASARDKRLARQGKADVLLITPESLALLLSYGDASQRFRALRCVVVDEWHELLGNKRGVLLQLCLARLRQLSPAQRTWGLSATLGNLEEARAVLLPHAPQSALVAGARPRVTRIRTLLPPGDGRLPWSGHLGLSQLASVYQALFAVPTSLLFTNTRAQAELWHRALQSIWQEDLSTLALHHGSLDPALRRAAEQGLREGQVRCVVATSSLDLGVDFPAVDQVLQIGSPKGVARLLQRAGRSRHRPGEAGEVVCVPAQALELMEYAAARQALARGALESRPPMTGCVDVLAQHLVTLALGGGFQPDALLEEVRGTHAYAALDKATWQAVLDFIVQGGQALSHYPEYCRVQIEDDGTFRVSDRRVALRHRLSVGTISSDGLVSVKFLRGGGLGAVEEGFLARLRPGELFHFAGRTLELVRLEGMTAYVRRAKGGQGAVASWQGGRLPLSGMLARDVERLFTEPGKHPEMGPLVSVLRIQAEASALPQPGRLVVERIDTRRGSHLFLYPFAGRAVHEGLAAVLALRWGRRQPNTFTFTVNDYGLMLSLAEPAAVDTPLLQQLLSPEQVAEDLREGINLSELVRRHFRDIARVSGLLTPSLPGGAPRSLRQIQASSGLLHDVLRRYDPGHILLAQAEHEVLTWQLELPRLEDTLRDLAGRDLVLCKPPSLTPLSFPLWTESLRGQLSTETWQARIRRAAEQLEKRYARLAR